MAYIGEPEGLHPNTTTDGCGLQDPLWHVSQGVCWPDLSDIGSWTERAQESTYKQKLGQSAIAEHAANESHVIDWEVAKVVDTHIQYVSPEMCT